jgi:hypothetical protein
LLVVVSFDPELRPEGRGCQPVWQMGPDGQELDVDDGPLVDDFADQLQRSFPVNDCCTVSGHFVVSTNSEIK